MYFLSEKRNDQEKHNISRPATKELGSISGFMSEPLILWPHKIG